jgi:hypothetical protein
MTRARKKNRRKQTRKKRGGMRRVGRVFSTIGHNINASIPPTVFNMNLTPETMKLKPMTPETMKLKPMTPETMTQKPMKLEQPIISKLMTQETMTSETMTQEQPIIPKLITPEDVLKFMRENSISIEDLDNISNKTKLVVGETVENAVEKASNKKSIDWSKIREMQNKAYTAFTQINVFTHVWKKIVEDECNKLSNEDKDKCFSIRGIVYISFMVFLIILKLVDSHNKNAKVSESELVNIVNTIVTNLLVDRLVPTTLQEFIAEQANKQLSKQEFIKNQVSNAMKNLKSEN